MGLSVLYTCCAGLDVHKKTISCCVNDATGPIRQQGTDSSHTHRPASLDENTSQAVDTGDGSEHFHGLAL